MRKASQMHKRCDNFFKSTFIKRKCRSRKTFFRNLSLCFFLRWPLTPASTWVSRLWKGEAWIGWSYRSWRGREKSRNDVRRRRRSGERKKRGTMCYKRETESRFIWIGFALLVPSYITLLHNPVCQVLTENYPVTTHSTLRSIYLSFRKQKEHEEEEKERRKEERLRKREQKLREREERRNLKRVRRQQEEEQKKLQMKIAMEERRLLLAQRNLESIRLIAELLARAKVPQLYTPHLCLKMPQCWSLSMNVELIITLINITVTEVHLSN